MTLAEAFEHTRWDMELVHVVKYPPGSFEAVRHQARMICEVCDNELGCTHFVVFADREANRSYHVDLGPRCASDLESP